MDFIKSMPNNNNIQHGKYAMHIIAKSYVSFYVCLCVWKELLPMALLARCVCVCNASAYNNNIFSYNVHLSDPNPIYITFTPLPTTFAIQIEHNSQFLITHIVIFNVQLKYWS